MRPSTAAAFRWATVGCLVASAALLLFALPLDAALDTLKTRISGFGVWAPLAFAVTYGLAATLFIPASALSLAAGALFGIWLGTVAVWLGATISIILSFLIARYAARARVEAMAAAKPRFAAVDRAVGEQGWKIVALMRLSPVFPFTLQNYLFGVSSIGFWPSCIASATFIIPGTFLYVYAGYAGGAAATAATSANGTDLGRLALQLAGLLATVVLTVYIARLAAKAVAKHAPDESRSAPATPTAEQAPSKTSPVKAVLTLLLSVACLVASASVFARRESIRSNFLSSDASVLKGRTSISMNGTDTASGPLHRELSTA